MARAVDFTWERKEEGSDEDLGFFRRKKEEEFNKLEIQNQLGEKCVSCCLAIVIFNA